ncbi:CsbD family protein [Streptomyces sp. Ag109_G2-15]|uniref:CsbD family protein n=1 Tax=Streptomyces sp. Ag109_G2-15 TaxID=1938850 RepID=UPI000BC97F02|nr:CsbD family protein [Streptomyces sp. Ag109_G2-15]SOD82497.1 CsbD-like [Streptomyces sp. Ag109_G2-15]
MSLAKKIAHKAEAMKGGAKKTTGRATGSRRLQAEGRGDQVKGNIKQAGAKIKDAFKH